MNRMQSKKNCQLLAGHHEAADADELKIDATDTAEERVRGWDIEMMDSV